MTYKYITDNNLYQKQNYMYSEYQGLAFLREYLSSRYEYLNKSEDSAVDHEGTENGILNIVGGAI